MNSEKRKLAREKRLAEIEAAKRPEIIAECCNCGLELDYSADYCTDCEPEVFDCRECGVIEVDNDGDQCDVCYELEMADEEDEPCCTCDICGVAVECCADLCDDCKAKEDEEEEDEKEECDCAECVDEYFVE